MGEYLYNKLNIKKKTQGPTLPTFLQQEIGNPGISFFA
jgi:hypothetical protein